MAAPTIVSNTTLVSNADSATNWSAGALDTDSEVQGTGCIGAKVSNATQDFVYDYSGTGSFDFSVGGTDEGAHIYVWLNCLTPTLDTFANGGLGIIAGNGTDSGIWYVGGQGENYGGGWKCFVIDTARDFDAIIAGTWTTTGNPAQLTAVDQIGGRVKTISTIMGNFNNGLIDQIRVGYGLILEDGDGTTPGDFDELLSADEGTKNNRYGVIRKVGGVYLVQGEIQIGHDTGTTVSRFEDDSKVVVFEEALDPRDGTSLVAADFYGIVVQNNTYCRLGDSSGTGASTLGISGITIQAGDPNIKPYLHFNDSTIDNLYLYALTATDVSTVKIGDSANALTGSTMEMVDCTFNRPDLMEINISGSPLLLRNKNVSSADTAEAAVQLYAPTTIDGDELSVILGDGFSSIDNGTTDTLTVNNHDFSTNVQWLRIYGDKTWDLVNPVGTPTTSDRTDFNFTVNDLNQVNRKYSLDLTVQTPSGTAISGATTYVYEGTTNQDLPSDNRQTTNGSGLASSDVLTDEYTWDGSSTPLDVTSYGGFAVRVYKYLKNPFVAAQGFTAAVASTVSLTDDGNIAEATQATAITAGSGITYTRHGTGETDTRPMKVINYDAGTGSVPTIGETMTEGSATGVVLEYIGDAVSGTLVLETWNGTEFTDNQTITGGTSTFSATTDTAGFYEEYTWEIDANSLSLQTLYDYENARLAEDPINASFIPVVTWGTDEIARMVQSTGAAYFTERNVGNTEGVWIANGGAGTISYLTADDGTQYIPPVQYSFTLTGLVSNTEVRIYDDSDDSELAGTESSGTSFTYQYIYSGDVTTYVVIFHLDYKEIRLVNLTLSNADQSIPVQQQIDRVYSNP